MTNLQIAGAKIVETTVEEFVAFCMDKKTGITVTVLDAELTKLHVEFKKSAPKAEKAALLFEKLAEEVEKAVAFVETTVAANHKEEENTVKPMSEEEALNYKNRKALENSPLLRKTSHQIMEGEKHEYVNPVGVKVDQQINEIVAGFYRRLGEHKVTILSVVPFLSTDAQGNAFSKPDQYNRIGYVDVLLPAGYASVRIRNKEEKRWDWYDFQDFNYNQLASRKAAKWNLPMPATPDHKFNLELGSGVLRLAIRKNAIGKAYVRMPVDYNEYNGQYEDIFRTSDIRWGRPNSANNGNVEAALTAGLQFYWEQLVMENPENRQDFDASCMNCRNLQWFRMKDGVTDDIESEDTKSTAILNQPNVEELAQVGSFIKQGYCTKRKFFVDEEAVKTINKLTQEERRYYDVEVFDRETGESRVEQRFQGRDEILVAGKPVKVREVRAEMTRETCRTCPFYHKNAYKGENAIGNERVAKREEMLSKAKTESEKSAIKSTPWYKNPFVQTHWSSRARAGRQMFETLMAVNGEKVEWVPGFPADVAQGKHVFGVRVAGIGGVNVYFSDAIIENMSQEEFFFKPSVEEFDAVEAAFNKMVGMIYFAAFNRDKMTASSFMQVTQLVYVEGKPEGITEKQSDRWDGAVYWFEQSLDWAKQREEAKNRAPFTTKFYAGIEHYIAEKGLEVSPWEIDLQARGVREIHVEDLISETLMRVEEGGLKVGYEGMFEYFGLEKGYEDLNPEEFIRFLDDTARDYVTDSLITGEEFVIVGGIKEDEYTAEVQFARDHYGVGSDDKADDFFRERKLVAGALQAILAREVNGLLYGVNRAADKVEEFMSLQVAEDVLVYIAEHAGLLNK